MAKSNIAPSHNLCVFNELKVHKEKTSFIAFSLFFC